MVTKYGFIYLLRIGKIEIITIACGNEKIMSKVLFSRMLLVEVSVSW